MTVLFKVQNNISNKSGIRQEKCLICRASSKNVIAFTKVKDFVLNNFVYVCDLVTPWNSFLVCTVKYSINILEWNEDGELLLIGLKGGDIEIWAPTHQAISSWRLLSRTSFPGEDIIGSKFFHNGNMWYFNSQKKELPYGTCERLDHNPTVCKIGNSPVEGIFAVTASGLLGACVVQRLNQFGDSQITPETNLKNATRSIGLSRRFIKICHLSHSDRGSINIAVSYTSQSNVIYCFKANVCIDTEDNLQLSCETLPSIFLNSKVMIDITKLIWCMIGNEDVIIVAYKSIEGYCLEQWNLTRKHNGVHTLLQKNKSDCAPSESWENRVKLNFSTNIQDICVSNLPSDYIPIHVIYSDNTIQLFESGLNGPKRTVYDRLSDERKDSVQFVSSCITAMSQILLVFDNFSQMYALQIMHPHQDKPLKANNFALTVALLEFTIISGVDASDILLLNMGHLDILMEKLTENFSRQPINAKQFYYSSFLCLKSNICRIHKQQDFDNLILLHSISITFKSLLRPSDLSCHDKGPADNLSVILSEYLPDIDKVLCNLDAKDFTVEPFTLQSLQQLIQWVADLALNMLYKLPDDVTKAKFNKRQGYDISRDMMAISSIRELLVIIRIWGLLNSHCLPIYTKSVDNVDVLFILFRLLTRLAQNTAEPDDMLLDECNLLSSQILIPVKQSNTPTTLLNTQMLLIKSYPMLFETFVEPCFLQDIPFQQVIFGNCAKDDVSNLQLGSKTSYIRQCVRCGFRNSLSKLSKTSAMKAWCNRWLNCHCGGFWRT